MQNSKDLVIFLIILDHTLTTAQMLAGAGEGKRK